MPHDPARLPAAEAARDPTPRGRRHARKPGIGRSTRLDVRATQRAQGWVGGSALVVASERTVSMRYRKRAALLASLAPGIERARMMLYKGIDAHGTSTRW